MGQTSSLVYQVKQRAGIAQLLSDWFLTGARDYSHFHIIQTSSEAFPASISMDTVGSFP
jgi:hypothetical protein